VVVFLWARYSCTHTSLNPETGSGFRMQGLRFRRGLVFKAHRLLYHSTLGLRVIKKKEIQGLRLRKRTLLQVLY